MKYKGVHKVRNLINWKDSQNKIKHNFFENYIKNIEDTQENSKMITSVRVCWESIPRVEDY